MFFFICIFFILLRSSCTLFRFGLQLNRVFFPRRLMSECLQLNRVFFPRRLMSECFSKVIDSSPGRRVQVKRLEPPHSIEEKNKTRAGSLELTVHCSRPKTWVLPLVSCKVLVVSYHSGQYSNQRYPRLVLNSSL